MTFLNHICLVTLWSIRHILWRKKQIPH